MAILLSFGAMLIGAVVGGAAAWRNQVKRFALLGAWIAVCWGYYFFVDVRDHQHVYVGWRAGHLLFIAFAPLVGYALQELNDKRPGGLSSLPGRSVSGLLPTDAAGRGRRAAEARRRPRRAKAGEPTP